MTPHRDPGPAIQATIASLEANVRVLEARQRKPRLLRTVLVSGLFVIAASVAGLGAGYAGYREGIHRLAREPLTPGAPLCDAAADRALMWVHDGSCLDFYPLTDGDPPWGRR